MAQSKYLAVDLGAESGRGVVGSLDGGRLELREVHRFPNTPVRILGHLHWDVLRLFQEVKVAIGKAAEAASPAPLTATAIDSWAADFGLIGPGGSLIGNPHHYRDPRTDGMIEKAARIVPKAEIFERTGIQFIQFNTVYQLLAAQEQQPGLLETAQKLLMIGELCTYFLTGRAVAEFTNATTTQLYDPRRGAWSQYLFERFGFPLGIMPDVVQPGTAVGELLPAVREETRVGAVPVLVPAVHDTGSAVAAVPARGRDWAFISSGTWSLVGIEVPGPIITEESLRHNFTNEGGVAGTYRFLKNVMGLWLLQECRRAWQLEGETLDYGELTELARAAPPLRTHVDPDDPSFFKPGQMPERIRAHCGRVVQPLPVSRGELVRCILESLALKYRYVLERLEKAAEWRVEVVHIVGGGTQNELLNQMTADATGRVVVAGPIEATAIGNILIQGIATGRIENLADGRAVVRRSFELHTYEPSERDAWDEAYGRFAGMMGDDL